MKQKQIAKALSIGVGFFEHSDGYVTSILIMHDFKGLGVLDRNTWSFTLVNTDIVLPRPDLAWVYL